MIWQVVFSERCEDDIIAFEFTNESAANACADEIRKAQKSCDEAYTAWNEFWSAGNHGEEEQRLSAVLDAICTRYYNRFSCEPFGYSVSVRKLEATRDAWIPEVWE